MIRYIGVLYVVAFVVGIPALSQAETLRDAMKISAAGMKVQSDRLRIVAQNIANADSTGLTPGEAPYRRKTIIFHNRLDRKRGIEMVGVRQYGLDKSPFNIRYEPNHPAADAQGYVLYPNINKTIEMMDSKEAEKSYEANLNTIEVTKTMLQRTVDMLR